MNKRPLTFVLSLIMGCILVSIAGCSTYTIEEDQLPPEENKDDNSTHDIVSSDTIFTTGTLPESESIWGGKFLVWKTVPCKPNEIEAILITLDEFYDIAQNAIITMEALKIDGISSWRFLTEDEAKSFRNEYNGSNIYTLNDWLLRYGLTPFKHDEGQRYLCAGGTRTFAFSSKTISKAGPKKKYYFRGTKTVTIIKTDIPQ